MFTKRGAALLLCGALVLGLCACAPAEPEESPVAREPLPSVELDFAETDELVIWVHTDERFGDSVLNARGINLETMFQRLYPGVSIRTEYAAQGTQVPNQMPSGYLEDWNGRTPDLILFSASPFVTFLPGDGYYGDLYEMIDDGRLIDLNPLIEQDAEFDLSRYDEKLMNAGLYRGGRYALPLSGAPLDTTLYGVRSTLEAAGFRPEALENGADTLKELARLQREHQGKSLLSGRKGYFRTVAESLFFACAPDLVDRDAGLVTADRAALKPFCEGWKALFYDGALPQDADYGYHLPYDDLLSGQRLLALSGVETFDVAGLPQEEALFLQNLPDLSGGVTAECTAYAVICAEGSNKLNAWRFVKMMLSEEAQTNRWLNEEYLPALLSARDFYQQEVLETGPIYAQVIQGAGYALSQHTEAAWRSALTEIDRYQISSPQEFRIFEESMRPYFSGTGSYNESFDALKAALRSYLAGE